MHNDDINQDPSLIGIVVKLPTILKPLFSETF